jgi:hypothetical protein
MNALIDADVRERINDMTVSAFEEIDSGRHEAFQRCAQCNRAMHINNKHQEYCSTKCRQTAKNNLRSKTHRGYSTVNRSER